MNGCKNDDGMDLGDDEQAKGKGRLDPEFGTAVGWLGTKQGSQAQRLWAGVRMEPDCQPVAMALASIQLPASRARSTREVKKRL